MKLFDQDLTPATRAIAALPNADKITTNQVSALIDFAFNAGTAHQALRKGGAFYKALAQNKPDQVCSALPSEATTMPVKDGNGNVTGHKKLRGLVNRRKAEQALCEKQTNVKSGC